MAGFKVATEDLDKEHQGEAVSAASVWDSVHLEEVESDDFKGVAALIGSDPEYLGHVGGLIPYSNLVLADPRTFHGGRKLQRRLGGLGLNVLLHPETPIDRDLLTRIFLLADRLNMLFHFSAAQHFEGESLGTQRAFWMVTHSLGNALTQHPTMDERMRAVLTVEDWNVKGAELLSTHGSLARQQLINVSPERIASDLSLALDRPNEDFSITLPHLDGAGFDPRFLAVMIELARNQRKASKSHKGSLEVALIRMDCAKVIANSDCNYVDARDLKRALNADIFNRNLKKARGSQILLLLLDLLCEEGSSIRYEIGTQPFTEETESAVRLPKSGAHVSLWFGNGVREERDSDRVFQSRLVINGILVSGGRRE